MAQIVWLVVARLQSYSLTSTCLWLQVLEARVDHTRVVDILRKADHLPLVKDYLLAVQKSNLAAVNEAVNGLLIEEEDFAALRDSITTYDNFDQLSLASRLEMHELMEFRRISAFIYKKALRWRKAVALAKQDGLFKVRTLPHAWCIKDFAQHRGCCSGGKFTQVMHTVALALIFDSVTRFSFQTRVICHSLLVSTAAQDQSDLAYMVL